MFKYIKLFHKYYLSPRPETLPVKQNDFPMYIEPFDFEKYRKDIFAFQDHFTIEVAQTIIYNNEMFEIFRIEINNPSAKKKLLIFTTVHGNEFVTALVIPRLLADIVANHNFYEEWNIRIIAPLNPVGLKYQSRYNEDGYDINRDFKSFQTPQAQLERDEINTFNPDFIIDLHEHAEDGVMIFSSPHVSKKLQENILSDLKNNNVPLWNNHPMLKILGVEKGVSRTDFIMTMLMKILGVHPLMRYVREKVMIPIITTETSWIEKNMEKRITPHILVIKRIVEEF